MHIYGHYNSNNNKNHTTIVLYYSYHFYSVALEMNHTFLWSWSTGGGHCLWPWLVKTANTLKLTIVKMLSRSQNFTGMRDVPSSITFISPGQTTWCSGKTKEEVTVFWKGITKCLFFITFPSITIKNPWSSFFPWQACMKNIFGLPAGSAGHLIGLNRSAISTISTYCPSAPCTEF